MLSRRPRLLMLRQPRPKRCGTRVDNRRRRRRSSRARRSMPCPSAITKRAAMPMRRLGDVRRRIRTKTKTKRSSCLCLGCSTLRTTTPVLCVPVSSIHSMRSACSGTCGGAHAGEMMVRARRTFCSFRISSHLELMYVYCYSYWFYRFPLVSV